MAKHPRRSTGGSGASATSELTEARAPEAAPSKPAITIVGIGASAGGLAALRAFFQHVTHDSGLAYVVVVHLSPDHESHLAELLQPHVRMPVQQVMETTPLEPNQVYIIPPGCNLSAVDTHLRLSDLEEQRRERAPIDHFFRTLAATHDGASIGVVLTGTGSDGTLGVKEIKEKNGLVIVQDPAEAEYDGMPQSAVATGLVDLVLPLTAIPDAILRFARTEPRVAVPTDGEDADGGERQLLQKIFVQIRTRTGRDFTHYKRSTLLRRIGRRMQLRHVEELSAYLALLREQPDEIQALADDLLVTVTNFFRDREVFATLAADVVPRLFEGKEAGDELRVWSVGCATGEEAYSLAILLLEEAARRDVSPRLQLFASDLHDHSLARAREGFYPGDIATDVSPERLERFFAREDGGYRIRKEVRELVVFAPHNLLSDPPFSKLDLVTCRNVLIYLQRAVQHEIVELFHYALRPDGFLVLGTSEAVDGTELFRVVDKKRCVYRKRNVPVSEPRLPVFPLTRMWQGGQTARTERTHELIAPGPLHQRLVERYAPPSLLVSPDDNVVHLSEHVGRYLVHPGGEPTTSVYRLVREELRYELRALLQGARARGEARRSKPISVQFDGERAPVVVHVRPAPDSHDEGFALVIFDEREPPPPEPAEPAPAESARARELEAELTLMRHRLQSTVEEFETGQEELRASNEEFQSANEELRSTLEELETSKEELQSINEELQTVNQENRHRVEELRQLTGDLQNLLVATDIATLFLDRELRIMRFTPRIGELFNVRPADRGRPLSDLTHRLGYAELQHDARRVLDTLVPLAHEVRDDTGHWYLARLLPYRSAEDKIEGVVITFVDITSQKRAEEVLRESEARQAFLLALADRLRPLADPVEVQAVAARLLGEHLGANQVHYGETTGEAVVIHQGYGNGLPPMVGTFHHSREGWGERLLATYRAGRTAVCYDAARDPTITPAEAAVIAGAGFRAYVAVPLLKAGVWVATLAVHAIAPRAWTADEIVLVEETAERTWAAVERARAEAARRESEARYRMLFDSIDEGFCVIEVLFDGERPTDYRFIEANPAFILQTGLTDAIGQTVRELAPAHEAYWFEIFGRIATTGEPTRFDAPSAALGRYYDVYAFRVGEPEARRVAVLFNDVSTRKRAEAEAGVAREEIERRVATRTAELAQANARLQAEVAARARSQAERNELLRRLASAQESERRHLARDLHDEAGQHLAALGLGLQALADVVPRGSEVDRRVEALRALAATLSRELHALAVQLRPKALDDFGLEAAVTSYVQTWSQQHGIAVAVHARLDAERLAPAVESAVYRIVQEALTNVARHSGAMQASVVVERRDGRVVVIVEDDGRGFDPEAVAAPDAGGPPAADALSARSSGGASGGLGLLGIRERATLLGGSVEIESGSGQGTTLFVRIPIQSPMETLDDDALTGDAFTGDTTAGDTTAAASADGPHLTMPNNA